MLHGAAREADGRAGATPSMVVIDTHLARRASNGGFTFHDRGARTAASDAPAVATEAIDRSTAHDDQAPPLLMR